MNDVQTHLERLALEPAHPESLTAVEGVLATQGRWEELLRVYEDSAHRGNAAVGSVLLRKAAMVCLNELASAARAEAYLKQALEAAPTALETLQALRELYMGRGEYERGLEVYERELARTSDAQAKAQGLVEVATIYLEPLNRLDKALPVLRQALRADVANPAVHRTLAAVYELQGRLDQAQRALLKELEVGGPEPDVLHRLGVVATQLLERPKLHERAQEAAEAVLAVRPDDSVAQRVRAELEGFSSAWRDRIQALHRRATALMEDDPDQAAELWLSVAELQFVYGNQPEAALVSLENALASKPGHVATLRLMEEIYGTDDRYAELAQKLEMMAAYTRDPAVSVDLYLKAALHYAVRLDNPEASARLYTSVLKLEPGNKVASNALAEHYRERGEWASALEVLGEWADRATQASDKVAAHYACCRILEEELADREGARAHYEAILALDPTNQAAARALEAAYRASDDHGPLAKALFAKLEGLQGEGRVPVLEELGDLYAGPLDRPEEALRILGELYAFRPTGELRERLEELAALADDFLSLVTHLEGGLEGIESNADRVEALHSLAALYEGARDAPLEALRIHRRILVLKAEDPRAKAAVARLTDAVAQSGDTLAVLEEQVEAATHPGERVVLLNKLARALVEEAKDYVRAMDVYREVLKLAPEDKEALEAVLALYRRDQRWAEVAEILERKVESLEGAASIPVRLELATLLSSALDRPEEAVDQLRAILEIDETHVAAVSALEGLLSRTQQVLEVAEVLEPRFVAVSAWEKAAAMLEIRIRHAADGASRLDLLQRLAQLYQKELDDPNQTLGVLLRAFQADPGRRSLRPWLQQMGQAAGELAAVVRAFRTAVVVLEDDDRVEVLLRAGALAEQLGDLSGATLDYLRALGQESQTDRAALEGLRRLVQAGAEVARVVEVARQIVDALEEPQKTAVGRVLARFYEQDMKQTSDAIAAWNAILDANPDDQEARAELDRLYQDVTDPHELVGYLRRRMQDLTDDPGRARVALQIADVLSTQAGDTAGAVEELTQAVTQAPGQKVLWRKLSELQLAQGQTHEAAHSMHKEINLLPEGEERQERLLHYADLLASQLGDMNGAVAALQAVTAQRPDHPVAITLLEKLLSENRDPEAGAVLAAMLGASLRAAHRWDALAALQQERVASLSDPSQRLEALKELAELKAHQQDDPAGAYTVLERAFRENPLDEGVRMQLEHLAEASGSFEALAQAYGAALDALGDAQTQKPIRRRLAEILDKRLGRGAEAVEHYKAVSGGQLPTDLASLEAMERLLREQQNSVELAEVLHAMLHHLPPEAPDRKRAVLLELGHLCEAQLNDKARAVEAYRSLLTFEPKNGEALRRLQKLLSELQQYDALADILDALIALGPSNPELVDDLGRRAAVAVHQGHADVAFQHYKNALLKRRDNPDVISGLEALIQQATNKLEIAQVLEPVYTAKQDHAKLAWVLEQRLEATEDAVQRKGLLRRIGDIYENRLQQTDRAFSMARRSLSEDPSDMGVRMWIEKLASETGAQRELATAYVEEAQKSEPPLNLQFHRRAAAIYHEKLNDHVAAVAEYRAILALDARDEKSLTGLESIFRQTENHTELVGILQLRLEQTAGLERKREYLQEIATIQAERLGDAAAAVGTYRQILDVTPDDPEPFSNIERLLADSFQWDELIDTYAAEEERLAEKRGRDVASRRLELAYRRGRIIDIQLGDIDRAADIFEAVLQEHGRHESTVAHLEERAQLGTAQAIRLLEGVYSQQGEWQNYIQLLELKLQHTPETELRREVYVEMARAADENLNAQDIAFGALTRAFNENRADVDLLDSLQTMAEKYGNWDQLVAVLGQDLDAVADPALRQNLLRRLGEICGLHLNDSQRAVAYLQHALQYDPRDKEALHALDALLERNEMWAALADVIERRVEVAEEPSEKSQLLERLAAVWGDRLMDAEAALRCHQQILEIDPDHPISLRSMQKLYVEVQDWDSLARNLTRQAEVLTDPEEQVRIHAAAGELFAEELGDMDAAIEHYQKVIELEPTHGNATQALDVLLAAEERWEDLAEHLRRQLAHTQRPENKLDINRRLGVILGEKLGRTEDALTSWEDVLAGDPKNLEAMRALLQLYSERAMWEPFVDIAGRMIPLAEPPEAKEVRFLLARALGENLGRRDEAIKLAREVRATEPHTADQMVKLGEMLSNIEAFDEAVIAFEKAATLEEDPDLKVHRYFEAAAIHREKLGRPNDAQGDYEAVLGLTPDPRAFRELADIYRDTQQWRTLVTLNEHFISYAEPDQRLPILTEIRDVQDEKLGEKELAFIAACRVYKEDPTDLSAAEVLERIALETDGAEEAAAVLEDEIDAIDDEEIKIALYRRVARLYAEDIKDPSSAEQMLRKILEFNPGDLDAIDRLADLGASEERYDKQIGALEAKLGHVAEDRARKAILFEVGRIWEDRIGDMDEAVRAYNRVLEIDGGDNTALDCLARIFEHEHRWTELAHTLTRKVEVCEDVNENIGLRMRVAQICEGELGDPETAIQWYRGVLDFEAGHAGALSALDRLYTVLERWSELIQVFELQIAQAQDDEARIQLLSKMAAIYENEFSSAKDAAGCYERIFQIDSTHLGGLKNLERLLRTLGEWNRLIEVLEHHITLIDDAEEITSLYLQIGEVYYRELARVDKAEQIYQKAREFNSNSTDALAALGQLYERSGNWFQSLEMLQREADALSIDDRALPILMRIGRINEDMLMDIGAAQTAYQRALEINANYPPALSAMKDIAKASEQWDAYADYLTREAETADDPEEQTDLFAEAAEYYQNIAEDEMSAINYYQRALETSPGHFETCKALAEIYFRNEMWAEAGDMYRVVVQELDKSKDPKEFCQKHYRLGYISEKLGEKQDALEHYRRAFDADATYLPALEGLGQALLAVEDWDEAQKVFQTIIIHHRDSLTESEVVDVQAQLGEISLRQNQPDRAYRQFEKALDIDPDHPSSLSALAQLDEQRGSWTEAYERLSRLGNVAPGPERLRALMRMSEIATDRLKDVNRALEPLERARKAGQASVEILDRLADLLVQTGQGTRAAEALEEAVERSSDAEHKSDLCFKLARVYETEIKHEPIAVQKYNEALDAMPTNVKAFEALERILSARNEWALLEANYRAMIGRSKALSPQARLVLWRNLAELYRRVLRNVDSAIMAYEVIQKMDPGRAEDASILAELYAQKPDKRAQAIEMSHALLRDADNPVAPIRSLRKLYHAAEEFDAVFVLCGVLQFLNEADDEERKILQYLSQGVPPRASRGLLEDHWKLIRHPHLENPVGRLASAAYRSAPDFFTVPARELGLKKRDYIDVRTSDLYFANMVRYAGKVLGIQGVDLYRKSGSMEALHLANAQPPALVAGEAGEIFRDTNQGVVLYHVGRGLAYARPEMFLARMYPGDDMRDMLLGLCVIYNRSLQHNGNPAAVERWAQAFERLPQPVLKRLQPLIMDAYNALTQGNAFQEYAGAVEYTVSRAGLIVAGDLGSAVRGANDGDAGAWGIETRERVKQLVLFAVSKEYLQVRRLIGAALVVQQSAQQPA